MPPPPTLKPFCQDGMQCQFVKPWLHIIQQNLQKNPKDLVPQRIFVLLKRTIIALQREAEETLICAFSAEQIHNFIKRISVFRN